MKRACLGIVAALMLVVTAPAAKAGWSFRAMGNQIAVSNPSCAQVAGSEAVCAVANSSHKFAVARFVGGAWQAWQILAGTIASSPSCVSRGTREVICVARGLAAELVYTRFNGTSWSAPAVVAAPPATSAPSCARINASKILCVIRNGVGGWSSATYTGAAWSAFTTLIADTIYSPSCASDLSGRVVCGAAASNLQLLVNRFNGSVWEGFLNLGGIVTDQPACDRSAVGNIRCIVRATDFSGFARVYLGPNWAVGNWGAFASLGGFLESPVSCVPESSTYSTCVMVSGNSTLYANAPGVSWTWAAIGGGAAIGTPSCASFTTVSTLCAVRGLNNRLFSVIGSNQP